MLIGLHYRFCMETILFKCYSEINKWQQSGTITNGYLLDLQSRFNLNINQLLGVGALLHDQLIYSFKLVPPNRIDILGIYVLF